MEGLILSLKYYVVTPNVSAALLNTPHANGVCRIDTMLDR